MATSRWSSAPGPPSDSGSGRPEDHPTATRAVGRRVKDVGNGLQPRLIIAIRMSGVSIGEPLRDFFGTAHLRGRRLVDDVTERLPDALESKSNALAPLIDVVIAESLEANDRTGQQRVAEVRIEPSESPFGCVGVEKYVELASEAAGAAAGRFAETRREVLALVSYGVAR